VLALPRRLSAQMELAAAEKMAGRLHREWRASRRAAARLKRELAAAHAGVTGFALYRATSYSDLPGPPEAEELRECE
jgi:hypothetical protein